MQMTAKINYSEIAGRTHLIYCTPRGPLYRQMAIMLEKSLRTLGQYRGLIVIFTDNETDFKEIRTASTQIVELSEFSECPLTGRMVASKYLEPKYFDQIMYLDCDILCTAPVEPLFSANDCLMYSEEYFLKSKECKNRPGLDGVNNHYFTSDERIRHAEDFCINSGVFTCAAELYNDAMSQWIQIWKSKPNPPWGMDQSSMTALVRRGRVHAKCYSHDLIYSPIEFGRPVVHPLVNSVLAHFLSNQKWKMANYFNLLMSADSSLKKKYITPGTYMFGEIGEDNSLIEYGSVVLNEDNAIDFYSKTNEKKWMYYRGLLYFLKENNERTSIFNSYSNDGTMRGGSLDGRRLWLRKKTLTMQSTRQGIAPGPGDNQPEAAQKIQAAILSLTSRRFLYKRLGYDQRPMSFLIDGTVGVGAARCEQFWKVFLKDGSVQLDIFSNAGLTCRLLQDGSKLWKGRWLHYEKMPIELTAEAATTLIIQQADERFRAMISLTSGAHAQYAAVHNMDIWMINRRVQWERPTVWDKILLLQQALRSDYELIIWLDADTLIVDQGKDLREASTEFQCIGMCKHPVPWESQSWHFNAGVVFVRNCELAKQFFARVWELGKTGHRMQEQARIMECSKIIPGAIQAIDNKWNSEDGLTPSSHPIIKGWHGMGPKRLELMSAFIKSQNKTEMCSKS